MRKCIQLGMDINVIILSHPMIRENKYLGVHVQSHIFISCSLVGSSQIERNFGFKEYPTGYLHDTVG